MIIIDSLMTSQLSYKYNHGTFEKASLSINVSNLLNNEDLTEEDADIQLVFNNQDYIVLKDYNIEVLKNKSVVLNGVVFENYFIDQIFYSVQKDGLPDIKNIDSVYPSPFKKTYFGNFIRGISLLSLGTYHVFTKEGVVIGKGIDSEYKIMFHDINSGTLEKKGNELINLHDNDVYRGYWILSPLDWNIKAGYSYQVSGLEGVVLNVTHSTIMHENNTKAFLYIGTKK